MVLFDPTAPDRYDLARRVPTSRLPIDIESLRLNILEELRKLRGCENVNDIIVIPQVEEDGSNWRIAISDMGELTLDPHEVLRSASRLQQHFRDRFYLTDPEAG